MIILKERCDMHIRMSWVSSGGFEGCEIFILAFEPWLNTAWTWCLAQHEFIQDILYHCKIWKSSVNSEVSKNLLWTLSNTSMPFQYYGTQTACSARGEASQHRVEQVNLSWWQCSAWCTLESSCPFGLPGHIADSYSTCHQPEAPDPYLQGCLPASRPPVCTGI